MVTSGTPEPEAAARTLLAEPPHPPSDVSRFTSDRLFGQPGIYPDGPPMTPAPGPPMDAAHVEHELARLLGALGARVDVGTDHPTLQARVPDHALRAALVLLGATVAAPALEAFLHEDGITGIAYGRPASPGRIIGTADGTPTDAPTRVVNDRYRAEHFALVTPSLAHDLLHDPVGAGQAEEAFLHGLLALVHLQIVAASPDVADMRTELARRQHSLAITLLNSRRPDDDRIRLIAPDGPGTIPGGDPRLQSSDFWSIPFVGGPSVANPAPPALSRVLTALAAPAPVGELPSTFDDSLAHWFDEHHGREWLSVRAQLRAGAALGLVDVAPDLRAWAGLDDSHG